MSEIFGSSTSEEDPYRKVWYAQYGEALIIKFLSGSMKITRPSYVDKGAHHSRYINSSFVKKSSLRVKE
jgi:hypothetical protein